MEVWLLLVGGMVSFLGLAVAGVEQVSFKQLYTLNHLPKTEAQFCCKESSCIE